jgi:hypothetical protein
MPRENRRETDPQTVRPRAENRERAEKSGAVGDAAAHTSRDRTNLSNGTPAGEKLRTGGKIESGRRRRGARFPRLNKLIAVEPKPGGGCKAYAWRHTSRGPQEGRPEAAAVSRRRTGPTKTRHGDALREEAVGKTAARREKSQRRRRASGGDYAVATVTLAPHRVNRTGPASALRMENQNVNWPERNSSRTKIEPATATTNTNRNQSHEHRKKNLRFVANTKQDAN